MAPRLKGRFQVPQISLRDISTYHTKTCEDPCFGRMGSEVTRPLGSDVYGLGRLYPIRIGRVIPRFAHYLPPNEEMLAARAQHEHYLPPSSQDQTAKLYPRFTAKNQDLLI